VRLTGDLGPKMGLPIDHNTFVRLIRNDFIKARMPGPRTYLIERRIFGKRIYRLRRLRTAEQLFFCKIG
jgi:hypothetical protein